MNHAQIDPLGIINKYYPEENELKNILLTHSRSVAARAVKIADDRPYLGLNRQFLYNAAMLHDIGIFLTDAPGIACMGSEPYLLHGRLGAELMRREGLEAYARVCERHTGAGLTREQIISERLPLPHQDFLPETEEECVICYADKFYSKSHLARTKTKAEAVRSLQKFGQQGVDRFLQWAQRYED